MIDVLVVGVGGLSCPALRVLSRSGVRSMTLVDDDVVDASNLQRQTLYRDEDIGMPKTDVARERLRAEAASVGADVDVRVVRDRFVPENARELVAAHRIVLEGADNFATKFLAFDAARLAHVPIVQAGAVRWSGWALASPPAGGPCMRCVFEDVPRDGEETCAVAGVIGPVVGVLGSVQAALALRTLHGDARVVGELWSYDALGGKLRRSRAHARPDCPSCKGEISDLSRERYAPSCAA